MSRRGREAAEALVEPGLILLTAWLLAGCALVGPAPARTDSVFESRAANTAERAHSAIESALVLVESAQQHRVFHNYVSVATRDAASSVAGARHSFERVQSPSDTSDALKQQLERLLDDADGEMSELTTAIVRSSGGAIDEHASRLQTLSQQLDEFQKAYS